MSNNVTAALLVLGASVIGTTGCDVGDACEDDPCQTTLASDGFVAAELPPARRRIFVETSQQLRDALASNFTGLRIEPPGNRSPLGPGDRIVLENETYSGSFVLATDGQENRPIVIKAARRLGARITGRLELAGADTWAYGIDFDGNNSTALQIVLRGTRARIQRSRVHNYNTPDDQDGGVVVLVQGTANKIYYTEFTNIDGRSISGKADGPTPMRSPHIYRCHFHDHLAPATNVQVREGIQLGQSQGRGSAAGGAIAHTDVDGLIEDTLFERWNLGDAENETISVKSSKNTIRGCTFVDTNLLNIRFGNDNRVESNWFEAVDSTELMGLGIFGDRNVAIANYFQGGRSMLHVNSGNQSMDIGWSGENQGRTNAWNGDVDYPYARATLLISNEGPAVIGRETDPDNREGLHLPAHGTILEAHRGLVRTQHSYPGTTVTPGLYERATELRATPRETAAAPRRLQAEHVGPRAEWIAP